MAENSDTAVAETDDSQGRSPSYAILLVRHAETEHNVKGIRAGSGIDSELTVHGANQAQALASSLQHRNVIAVYSSPMKRAIRTAKPVADACNAPLNIKDCLREKHLGTLEGVSFRESTSSRSLDSHFKVEGLESRSQLLERAQQFTSLLFEHITSLERDISAESDVPSLVIVSHGLFLPFLLRAILAKLRSPLPGKVSPWLNASYTNITVFNDHSALVEMNRSNHLRKVKRTRRIGSSKHDPRQTTLQFCRKLDD
ncbi:phosphoglycerate mutase family protein [Schizosaccharomyces japonicus yFS275]|uniref:Phosphoglycerate mutase family protein n=1 Tax=Schizosaccharomyces japonicus (strain yFS275 / FY16936) TaxID=402676 RepID=B6K541_SCHJY|nr:phosphoglycerate mutase family protein [Schizosaccharomyces japonicus yFS275]EEB08645.1 phosphoglycerate mutase family protein [Schizosaccharomyces japonicus yFS275]